MKTKDGTIFCSFCGKHSDFVEMMAAGLPEKDAHICDECIDKSADLIRGKRNAKAQQGKGVICDGHC